MSWPIRSCESMYEHQPTTNQQAVLFVSALRLAGTPMCGTNRLPARASGRLHKANQHAIQRVFCGAILSPYSAASALEMRFGTQQSALPTVLAYCLFVLNVVLLRLAAATDSGESVHGRASQSGSTATSTSATLT